MVTKQESLAERLSAYLSDRHDRPVSLANFTRMTGGATNEIWSFDLEADGETRPMVLRKDTEHPLFPGSRAIEGELIDYFHQRGLLVPRVYWSERDASVLGGTFFIMERVPGESLIKHLQEDPRYADARTRIAAQLGETLATFQQIAADDDLPPHLQLASRAPIDAVKHWESVYRERALDPHPVLELALQWLHKHLPPPRRLVLAHGDYRIQNVIYDESGLRCVLDWELAHFGDPIEDVAWVALRTWRGGRDHLPIGGVGTREEFLAAYESHAGASVDADDLLFWDIYATLAWATVTIIQANLFVSGHPNIEWANLGRRTAEVEWDLLQLLERAA